MSTRANIVIEYTDSHTGQRHESWLYHHCDGYVQGIGEEICQAVHDYNGYIDGRSSIGYLLSEFKRSYEDTTEMHGDIEFLYRVTFEDNAVTITARHGGYGGNYNRATDTARNTVQLYRATFSKPAGAWRVERDHYETDIREVPSYISILMADYQPQTRAWRGVVK